MELFKNLILDKSMAYKFTFYFFSIFILQACSHGVVPLKNGDQPIITISAFSTTQGINGNAEKPIIKVQGTSMPSIVSNVDAGTNLLFTGSAANPGGVSTFSISINSQSRISSGAPPLFDVTQTSTPDSKGLVPDSLFILQVSNTQTLAVTANSGDLVIVTVTAQNFGTGKTSSKLVYYPVDRKNQQQTNLGLISVPGTSVCQNTFPDPFPGTSFRPNCNILAIENPNIGKNIYMLKRGADCSSSLPSSIQVFIAPITDFTILYGTPTISSPILFQCCNVSFNPNQPPIFTVGSNIPISVIYKCN